MQRLPSAHPSKNSVYGSEIGGVAPPASAVPILLSSIGNGFATSSTTFDPGIFFSPWLLATIPPGAKFIVTCRDTATPGGLIDLQTDLGVSVLSGGPLVVPTSGTFSTIQTTTIAAMTQGSSYRFGGLTANGEGGDSCQAISAWLVPA